MANPIVQLRLPADYTAYITMRTALDEIERVCAENQWSADQEVVRITRWALEYVRAREAERAAE